MNKSITIQPWQIKTAEEHLSKGNRVEFQRSKDGAAELFCIRRDRIKQVRQSGERPV